jgi:hypothetical protein
VTYTSPSVAPPASLPFDPPAVTGAALDILRLDPADEDAARIAGGTLQAIALVEQRLDLEVSPWADAAALPAPVEGAAVLLTVELYRRKDAPFGVTDSWSVDGAAFRITSDVMRGVDSMLAPYRGRRGVA